MGHDTARLCTVQRAERCRAAPSPIQNNIKHVFFFFRQKELERLEKEKAERALGEKRCPVCNNKIYPAGAIIISEVAFCRTCVKCVECVRVFDGKDMALGPPNDPSPKPYCKFCFAKAFGISALNITEMVAIAPEEQILSQGL